MNQAGYNPLRWSCQSQGCFNEVCRPKIEVFAGCFPGRINFGDVDGLVEINGYFCVLEWKSKGDLGAGQCLTFERLSRSQGNVAFVVFGSPQTMEVDRYRIFWAGASGPFLNASLTDVQRRLSSWAAWAKNQPTKLVP